MLSLLIPPGNLMQKNFFVHFGDFVGRLSGKKWFLSAKVCGRNGLGFFWALGISNFVIERKNVMQIIGQITLIDILFTLGSLLKCMIAMFLLVGFILK